MFRSKKGFELSINMIVVVILGIALLALGFSIFSNILVKVVDIQGNVDEQMEKELNALLDDGGSVVIIPSRDIDVERGDLATLSMGISNIYREPKQFFVFITYAGTSAPYDNPGTLRPMSWERTTPASNPCGHTVSAVIPEECGTDWVRIVDREFDLAANERMALNFGFQVPKKVVLNDGSRLGLFKGQYVFDVDICVLSDLDAQPTDCFRQQANGDNILPDEFRFSSRHKVRLNVQ